MISRDQNRIIITLPDETKAEALEWLLTLFLAQAPALSIPTELHRSVRPTEAHLVQLESERLAGQREKQKAANLVEKNQGPVYPWSSKTRRR